MIKKLFIEKSEVQTILFDKDKWTVDSAIEWLKQNKKKFSDVETKEGYIHFRQQPKGKYKKYASSKKSNPELTKKGILFTYGIKESNQIKENDLGDENYKQISLINFIKNPPKILYGKINLGDYKEKFGMFKLGWNKYSNSETYHYYTLNGRKGSGGFTVRKAYELIQKNQLSTNPEYGDPNSSNWVSYKESKLSFEIEGMSRVEALRKANQMQKEGISVVVVYDMKDQDYSVFKKSHYDYLLQSNEISPKDWKVIKEFEVEGSESQDVTINKVKSSEEEQPVEVDINEPEERFVKKPVEVDINEPEETEEEIPEEEKSEEDITPEEFEPEEEEEGSDEELNKRKTFKLGKGPEPLNRVEAKQIKENMTINKLNKNGSYEYFGELKDKKEMFDFIRDNNLKFIKQSLNDTTFSNDLETFSIEKEYRNESKQVNEDRKSTYTGKKIKVPDFKNKVMVGKVSGWNNNGEVYNLLDSETGEKIGELGVKFIQKYLQENINDKLSGYEDVVCPYCGSKETVFQQYVDGGSWKCQGCGKWIKDKDIKESKQIKENFSRESDHWFDLLADNSDSLNPSIKQLAKDIKSGKIKPTVSGFNKFYNELQSLPPNIMIELDDFIDKIESGKYKDEFKYKYGNVSQISELFSLFTQAVFYNDSLEESRQISESPKETYRNIFSNHIGKLVNKKDKLSPEKQNQIDKILDKYLPNHREKGVNKNDLFNLSIDDITDLYGELRKLFGLKESRLIKESKYKNKNDIQKAVLNIAKNELGIDLSDADAFVIADNMYRGVTNVTDETIKKEIQDTLSELDPEIQAWIKASKELKNI